MTPEQHRRIVESIQECDRYIEREERRDARLRPLEVAERLDWYRSHRAKLCAMRSGASMHSEGDTK